MNHLNRKMRMFAFINSKKIVVVIHATNKHEARERALLISHLANIPNNCKVKMVPRGTIVRAPIFFDGHFQAIEDALAGA